MAQGFKHAFKAANRAELPQVVYNSGFQKCAPGYAWGPGVRDHYLIHYVVSGRGTLELEGRTFVLGPGDAFLIRPDVPARYAAAASDPWEYYWVGFAGVSAGLFLAQTGFAGGSAVCALAEGDRFRRSLLEIYKARGSGYPSAVRMAGYLQAALGLLMEATPPSGEEALALYARHGAEFIHQNYSRGLTIEEVARQVGVSRSYLYRAFRAEFACSPSDYLARCRIRRACQLLRHSTLSVGAVANSVGFEDHFYFSRTFRRITGVSPTAYRTQRS